MATEVQEPPSRETFHAINKPDDVIHDAMTGLSQQYPERLAYARTHKILCRADVADVLSKGTVTTVGFSGGGQ